MVFCGWRDNPPIKWPWTRWEENTLKAVPANRIYVLCINRCSIPPPTPGVNVLRVPGDLGHYSHIINGEKLHYWCGWTANMLTGAMIAYSAEMDFVYKEQDCLAFGPWLDRMYEEIGGAQCIFGELPGFPCAQSLFLVRHAFIPEFCSNWFKYGSDKILPEWKMHKMQLDHPDLFTRFSFGYDRARPFNLEDEVFYVQHLSLDELEILKNANLITT